MFLLTTERATISLTNGCKKYIAYSNKWFTTFGIKIWSVFANHIKGSQISQMIWIDIFAIILYQSFSLVLFLSKSLFPFGHYWETVHDDKFMNFSEQMNMSRMEKLLSNRLANIGTLLCLFYPSNWCLKHYLEQFLNRFNLDKWSKFLYYSIMLVEDHFECFKLQKEKKSEIVLSKSIIILDFH